ncbi:hypothetical protein Lalb_Chr01g0019761 [Lupinus albus]|uniref:Uncharacterized protein n=1 Tax=Lupinus albus TaxID=3870 RepID=A0A6A4R7F3_LUPAL|nr:hypothetical protein Lalb_Chr01g0019761 [Lupinus albus]
MAFSLKKIFFTLVHLMVIMVTNFVAPTQSRLTIPFLVNNHPFKELINALAPSSGGSVDHPCLNWKVNNHAFKELANAPAPSSGGSVDHPCLNSKEDVRLT